MTNRSPAVRAASLAVCNTAASSGDMIDRVRARSPGRLRQTLEPLLGGGLQQIGIAAGIAHDAAAETLAVIEQGLQQMFGKKVLMAPGEGFHLRGLQHAARAFGEIREVHLWHSVLISRPS